MKMRYPFATTILLAWLALPVHAGRPLATDDAGVIETGQCEVESFLARASEREAPSTRGGTVQFGCGVGTQTQVALSAATFRTAGQSEQVWTLSGKTALGEAAGGTWALAYGLNAVKAPGRSLGHEGSFINGVLTFPLGNVLKMHANLGWSHSQAGHQSTTNWALALEHGNSSGVDVMAETFASDRESSPWIQLGLRWAAMPDKLFIDASWGRQTGSTHPSQLTLGLKFAF